MFANVETLEFFWLADTDAAIEQANHGPENPGGDDRKESEGQHSHNLHPQLGEAVASEQPFIGVEQTNSKGCPDATSAKPRKRAPEMRLNWDLGILIGWRKPS